MAEDFQDKTEPPTPKKLADARKKGFVAKSEDLTVCFLLLLSMMIFIFCGQFMLLEIKEALIAILMNLDEPFDSPQVVVFWLRQGLIKLLVIVSPLILGVTIFGIACNLLQVGFTFSLYPLKPQWKNLNIFDSINYLKYFSIQTLIRILIGQTRWIFVTSFGWLIVTSDMANIQNLTKTDAMQIGYYLYQRLMLFGMVLAIGFFLLSLMDYAYQKWKFIQDLKMTRREVKDEIRQVEGDTFIKGKIRAFMLKSVQSNIKINVPRATLIITAGNQLAVALKYYPESMHVPKCVAKGAKKRSQVIIDLALQHGVPILDTPRLTKRLYFSVDFGGDIPSEFYHEVAMAFSQGISQGVTPKMTEAIKMNGT